MNIPDHSITDFTPLWWSMVNDLRDVFDALLLERLDLDRNYINQDGLNNYHLAALSHSAYYARQIAKRTRADPGLPDKDGATPLHHGVLRPGR